MKTVKVRITSANWVKLQELLFSEYPSREVATFLDCGWKEGSRDLVILINGLNIPRDGDIKSGVDSIQLNEQYSIRQALSAEKGKFATGLVHSHPEGYGVWPSKIDDKMDAYYAEYFSSFTPDRPFVSMIISKDKNNDVKFSGRVWWRGEWLQCLSLQVIGESGASIDSGVLPSVEVPAQIFERLNRLMGGMGRSAVKSLWKSRVVIIGAGGTGSAVFHSLVRACVGEIIVIDHDVISISNSERVHGFESADISDEPVYKVDIMKRLAERINPFVKVIPLKINAHSEEALKYIVESDLIFGCTDSQVGKVLVSNLAHRFLLPAIHVNVAMEVNDGKLSAELVQVVRYRPDLPCVHCRQLINTQLLSQELMSEEEKKQRSFSAAQFDDERKQMYWVDEPVLHTVGGTTTIGAEYAAKMGVGIVSGAFKIEEDFYEIDVLRPSKPGISFALKKRVDCLCSLDTEGGADQGGAWL